MVLAQEALARLDLDELLLIPTGEAPHKRIEPEPGPEVRLELTRRAAEGVDGVRVSDVEVAREGPSFAYRTLELIADELPGSDLTFVMGADVAAGLASWRRPERVLELADLAVAARPGTGLDEVRDVLSRLGEERTPRVVEMPALSVSSTLIRERVAAGLPIRWLVPEGVAGLIEARGLYAGGPT
jgi:nicotinate-nucleotide adenylyltransferase